jgi:DNA-binding response OmpR family regulator
MNTSINNADKFELPGHTVLIVDDESINLQILSAYLDNYGLEVLVARDGNSGLEKVHYTRPDLILLDVVMPGMDGFEVCRRLKADDTVKGIPVIFMTALTNMEDKVRGFELGAVDFITKPFQEQEILARISTHLRLWDLNRQLQEAKATLENRVEQRTAELTQTNKELHAEITERKRAEESLAEQHRLLRILIDNVPDSIYVKDIENRFIIRHTELVDRVIDVWRQDVDPLLMTVFDETDHLVGVIHISR